MTTMYTLTGIPGILDKHMQILNCGIAKSPRIKSTPTCPYRRFKGAKIYRSYINVLGSLGSRANAFFISGTGNNCLGSVYSGESEVPRPNLLAKIVLT